MFEPMIGPNKFGPARQMKWLWVTVAKPEIDTIDDLRDIISDRDMRYGSWQAGLLGLLAEADTGDTIFHVRANGRVASQPNNSIFLSEGWLSRDLLAGNTPDIAAMQAYVFKVQQTLPRTDPLSYRPTDPLLQRGGSRNVMGDLLQAIARAVKYGEPEPDFLDAARQTARFLVEDLYVPDDAMSGPARDKAAFIRYMATEARAGLNTSVQLIHARALQDRLSKPSRLGPAVSDKVRSENSYLAYADTMPVTIFDVARAGVDVLGELKTAHEGDGGTRTVLRTLIGAAGERNNFRALEPSFSVPSEVSSPMDTVARAAYEKVIALTTQQDAAAARAYRKDLLAQFFELLAYDADRIGTASSTAAAPQAVITAGVSGTAESVDYINQLWAVGLGLSSSNSPKVDYVVRLLRQVNADPKVRSTYNAYLSKMIRDFQERQKIGIGSADERKWLARLGN
jgi:hypothetical protein